ncbi:MAG: AAA family ATPase [Bacteroidales bacterium]|nr:AAA family ATPase [Bacteroidales bacterium]
MATTKPDTFRVARFHVESFMGITSAEVPFDPASNTLEFAGPNGAGKSSLIAAILWALLGRYGAVTEPVKIGAEEALVRCVLVGDAEIEVTKRIGADDKSATLTVKRDGVRLAQPQRVLDELLKAVAFDPIQFAAMKSADRVAELCRMFGGADVVERLDTEFVDLYQTRREVGQARDTAAGHVDSLIVPDGTPDEMVDMAAALDALAGAEAHNREVDARTREVADRMGRVAELDHKIEALQREVASERAALVEATRLAEEIEHVDVEPIRKKVTTAEAVNAAVRIKSDRAAAVQQRDALNAQYRELNDQVTANRQARVDAVQAMGVPVEGFNIDPDKGITISGVPFDALSSGEQLIVGFKIAAGNPKTQLPLVVLRHAAMVDDDNMALIEQLAEEHDVQVIIETVGDPRTAGAVELRAGEIVEPS